MDDNEMRQIVAVTGSFANVSTIGMSQIAIEPAAIKRLSEINDVSVTVYRTNRPSVSSDRMQAKIHSLEKTIQYMQDHHSQVLVDLHGEIARLQTICAELQTRDKPVEQKTEPKEVEKKEIEKKPEVERKEEKPIERPEAPIYLLVEKEKKKYQAIIERMSIEQKKRDLEIEHLRLQIAHMAHESPKQEKVTVPLQEKRKPAFLQLDLQKVDEIAPPGTEIPANYYNRYSKDQHEQEEQKKALPPLVSEKGAPTGKRRLPFDILRKKVNKLA